MYKYLFLSLILLLSFYSSLLADLQGQTKIDSLLKVLPRARDDTNKVNILWSLSFEYQNINPEKCLDYGRQGLELSKRIGWNKGISICYTCIGIYYYIKSDYTKALEYYKISLNNLGKYGDKYWISANYNNMGLVYMDLADYPKALYYSLKSLEMDEEIGGLKKDIAIHFRNIGAIYIYLSDYPKALEYHKQALKIIEEMGDKEGLANALNCIAIDYTGLSDYNKALESHQKALKIYEEIGNKSGVAMILGNAGAVYFQLKNYPQALENWQKALIIYEETGSKINISRTLGNIGELYLKMVQDTVLSKVEERKLTSKLNKEFNLDRSINYSLDAVKIAEEIDSKRPLIVFYNNLQEAYKEKGDYRKALEYHVKWAELKDSVFNKEKAKEIANLDAKRQNEVKDNLLKIQEMEITNARNERWALFGGIGFLLVVSIIILRQRAASEKLLLNILPAKIARRLKRKEYPIADYVREASVLFADIVNFTEISSVLGAGKTVAELNKIYTSIDKLADKYGMEKIKTIGDCYMVVSGVPVSDEKHAENAAMLALAIKELFRDYTTENGSRILFRIGLDCGDVTAGVIGEKKFIYDLWGDTVNTASRMEEYGEPGKIQVTERFREKLASGNHNPDRDQVMPGQIEIGNVVRAANEKIFKNSNSFRLEERGEIEIKGKGKMRTWFLESMEEIAQTQTV
jgi:class 3 adenylate cyclase